MTSINLNQEIADALCGIIVLGYSATLNSVRFEYDSNEDRSEYEKIQKKFGKLGVEITVAKSEGKSEFPLIVGRTGSVAMYGLKQAMVELGEVHKFAKILENAAEKYKSKTQVKFFGAYVGGLAGISTVDIIGASDLVLYKGKYRTATDEVRESYNKAKGVSNAVLEAITSHFGGKAGSVKKDGMTFRNSYMNKEIEEDYKEGYLFKSYHGMVKAMTTFMPGFKRTENFFFEIALTSDTSKVSSCFPCATFMQANNNPPTSIHLGRGDNWSIPDGADYLKQPWEACISNWYKKGFGILTSKNLTSQGIRKWREFVDKNSFNINREIPEIFLESLTFEKKFSDRIMYTLPDD